MCSIPAVSTRYFDNSFPETLRRQELSEGDIGLDGHHGLQDLISRASRDLLHFGPGFQLASDLDDGVVL